MDKQYEEYLIGYYYRHIESISMPEQMKPLLVEVLLRRAKEFELTSQDIYQDMVSLCNNLNKIEIAKMPKGYESAAGVYMGQEKTIKIAPQYLKRALNTGDYETLYEIFTHEVYHALCVDENGQDRLVSYNKYCNQYNATLREAIVEKAADRCVFSRNPNEKTAPYLHQNKFGYSDITFITDAIEATYGVTEKAFLKHAIMGRERLVEFLSAVSNEDKVETMDFLDRVEMNYTRLHSALYGKPPQKGKVLETTITDTMSSIYMICEDQIQKRIKNYEIEDFSDAERCSVEFKYAHNKLVTAMEHGINGFGYKVNSKKLKEKVEERVGSMRSATVSRICDFSEVTENKENFESTEEAMMLMRWARYGNLWNYERDRLDQAGVKVKFENMFSIPESTKSDIERFDFNLNWDNSYIVYNTYEFARQQMNTTKMRLLEFKDKVFNGIKNLFTKPKGLNPPVENITYGDVNSQNGLSMLTPEELDKFNKGVQTVLKEHSVRDVACRNAATAEKNERE